MSPVSLLDVNVLVALFDPDHLHHEAAHAWLADSRSFGWATCPMTENALVRILSNPSYSDAGERSARIARRLEAFCSSGQHVFWPDRVSLRDAKLFRLDVIAGHRQITDVYLLGLAKRQRGRLATFDRAIPLTAVVGARAEHIVVIPG